MDTTKREDREKLYLKEKEHMVRIRILAIRMAYTRKMGVTETSDILMQSPWWVYEWRERYDQRGLEGLEIFPGSV